MTKYVEALQSKQVPTYRAQQTSIPSFNFKLVHALQIKHHQQMKEGAPKSQRRRLIMA